MNILYLDATRSLYGASRALLTLLENIDRKEIRPYVVLANDVEDDLRLCAELNRLHIDYREYRLAVLRRQKYLNPRGVLFVGSSLVRSVSFLRGMIRTNRIDLVQTNTSTILSGAVAAALSGVPHVWHVHEIFRRWEGKILTRLLYALSSSGVAPSEATAHNLLLGNPALKRKLLVIKNGIDPTPFRTVAKSDVDRLRHEWSISPNDRVVGMVGRIGMWKGEEQFVQMARLVRQRHEKVKFVIVGGTFSNEEEHMARLQLVIDACGLGADVVVAGARDDVPVVLNLFDLLVHLPVRPEPFGLVAIEAMAAGKPVVAAATGGLAEIVIDGRSGFLVSPGDVKRAAERVITILEDEELRERLGRAGSNRVDAEFSSVAYAAQFKKLYETLLNHHSRRGNHNRKDAAT